MGTQVYPSPDRREVEQVLTIDETSVRVLLLDIEGTTTPVGFVYEVLFPFASRHLASYLGGHFSEPETNALIEALKAQHAADKAQGLNPPELSGGSGEATLGLLAAYGQWLIARDSKCPALKALQGKIWQAGYESGELHGQVYPDVPLAFERWRRQNREIAVYSSGSVLAQQLLFRSTTAGDLTFFLKDFFDTKIGIKTEAESYRRILVSLKCKERNVLFISDAVKELDAARSVGMWTALCMRAEPDKPVARNHPFIRTFDEVFL